MRSDTYFKAPSENVAFQIHKCDKSKKPEPCRIL